MALDRRPIGLGPVGDRDVHAGAPAAALLDQKARQGGLVAVGDHPQHLTGLAVLQHGDVAVAAAHGGFVDQQHPTARRAAMGGDQDRPRQAMAAGHGPHRHDLGVGHHRCGPGAG